MGKAKSLIFATFNIHKRNIKQEKQHKTKQTYEHEENSISNLNAI